MRTQSIDTSPDAERVLIGMLRSMPISKRFSIVQSWSRSMIEAGRFDVHQLYPQATMQEVQLLYAERHYGKDLVNGLRTVLQQRKVQVSDVLDFQAPLRPIVEVFSELGTAYALSGSLASSLYGMQRATMQFDFVAALSRQHERLITKRLASQYFLCEDDVKTAFEQRTSCVLLHIESLFKVVLALVGPRTLDKEAIGRARFLGLADGLPLIPVLSPEDIVVLQLRQFKSSGERADDIWYDLIGLLKVQGLALDLSLLECLAATLDVTSLLGRALVDAGLRDT